MKSACLSSVDVLTAISKMPISIALNLKNESDDTFPKVEGILYSINPRVFHQSLVEGGERGKKDDRVDYFKLELIAGFLNHEYALSSK